MSGGKVDVTYALDYESADAPRVKLIDYPDLPGVDPDLPDVDIRLDVRYSPEGIDDFARKAAVVELWGGTAHFKIDTTKDFLTSEKDAEGVITTFEAFDDQHRIGHLQRGRYGESKTYDQYGYLATATVDGPHPQARAWDRSPLSGVRGSWVTKSVTDDGYVTTLDYYNNGFCRSKTGTIQNDTNPVGTETLKRNDKGFVTIRNDRRGNDWTNSDYEIRFGRYFENVSPEDRRSSQVFIEDAHALLDTSTDVWRVPRSFDYDNRNRVVNRHPFGRGQGAESIGYDILDRVRSSTDLETVTSMTDYNDLHLVTCSGSKEFGRPKNSYQLGSKGLITVVQQEGVGGTGEVATSYANHVGQVVKVVSRTMLQPGSGTMVERTVEYDYTTGEGWRDLSIGPRTGEMTTITHYASGLVKEAEQALKRGSATISYTYDSEGRTSTVTDPDGLSSSTAYDVIGRIASQEVGGRGKTVYEYNGVDLRSLTMPGKRPATFGYDRDGVRNFTKDPDGVEHETKVKTDDRKIATTWRGENGSGQSLQQLNTRLGPEHQTTTLGDIELQRSYSGYNQYGSAHNVKIEADGIHREIKTTPAADNPYWLGGSSRTLAGGAGFKQVGSTDYHRIWRNSSGGTRFDLGTSLQINSLGEVDASNDDAGSGGMAPVQQVLERDLAGATLRYRDLDGRVRKQEVDFDGVVLKSYSPDGTHTQMEFTPGGRQTQTTYFEADSGNEADSPLFDAAMAAEGSASSSIEYDGFMRPVARVDRSGVRHTTAYDSLGQVTSRSTGSLTTSFEYDNGRVVEKTAPGGLVTRNTYVGGKLVKTVDPRGLTITRSYYPNGKLHIWQSGVKRETYHYNRAGQLERKVEEAIGSALANLPAGQSTTHVYHYEYHPDGSSKRMRVDDDAWVTYLYDEWGRRVGSSYRNMSIRRTLDKRGREVRVQISGQPDHFTTYTDGGHGGLVETKGELTFDYEPGTGRLQQVSHADGGAVRVLDWDPNGKPSRISLPGGLERSFTYDAADRIRSQVDRADGHVVAAYGLHYDDHGRVERVEELGGPDGKAAYDFAYDAAGRLASEDRSGLDVTGDYRIAYTYDRDHNRTSQSYQGNRVERTTRVCGFDADNVRDESYLTERMDLPATWTIDAALDLLRVAPEGPAERASLDLKTPSAEVALDGLFGVEVLPTQEQTEQGLALYRAGLGLGQDDRLQAYAVFIELVYNSRRWIFVRLQVDYLDADEAWQTVIAPGWIFLGNGLPQALDAEAWRELSLALNVNATLADRVGVALTWKDQKLSAVAPVTVATAPQALLVGGGHPVAFDQLTWAETRHGRQWTRDYRYADDCNRLLEVSGDDGFHQALSYTGWGGTHERVTTGPHGASQRERFAYDPLRRTAGIATTHPGRPDLVSRDLTNSYIADTWMRSSTTLGGRTQTFTYDGAKLLTTTAGGQTTSFAHTSLGNWSIGAEGIRTHLTDGRGNITGHVTGDGLARWFSYDAYGQVRERELSGGTWRDIDPTSGLKYRGMWYDAESKLYHMRNRYYDPSLGSFTQVDPAQAGNNWYAYAGGDPVNRWDPSGLWWRLYLEKKIIQGALFSAVYRWEWIDEPNVSKYDRRHIPAAFLALGRDMLKLSPGVKLGDSGGISEIKGDRNRYYVDFKGRDPVPNYNTIADDDLATFGFRWGYFLQKEDSWTPAKVRARRGIGNLPNWVDPVSVKYYYHAKKFNDDCGPAATAASIINRVPRQLLLGVVAGEAIDHDPFEANIEDLGKSVVKPFTTSVGISQIRPDTLVNSGIAASNPTLAEMTPAQMAKWLDNTKNSFHAAGMIQRQVILDLYNRFKANTQQPGIRRWLGTDVEDEVLKLGKLMTNPFAPAGAVTNLKVSNELVALVALAQNDFATPGIVGTNSLADEKVINDITKSNTYGQGNNALIWLTTGSIGFLPPDYSYIPESARK